MFIFLFCSRFFFIVMIYYFYIDALYFIGYERILIGENDELMLIEKYEQFWVSL